MRFYQMAGCGNAFAIFDARNTPLSFAKDDILRIADAQTGSGGFDQIIAIEPSTHAAAFMRIWNRDGSEVEACGNATRCVAWLLLRETGSQSIDIETRAGILPTVQQGDQIAVDMGVPLLEWQEIPLAEPMDTRGIDLKFGPIDNPVLYGPGAVNMGNPHIVFFVEDLDAINVEAFGPMAEGHMLFPQKTNVGFAQILSPDSIRLRVWERGVGVTLACGTGACAALVAAHRKGLIGRMASIGMDGGTLHIDWRAQDDHVIMTGPVELQASGEINL